MANSDTKTQPWHSDRIVLIQFAGCRQTGSIRAADRQAIVSIDDSSSTPQSLAQRSRIVLAAAAGSNNQQIAAELKIPPITVGKWRRSFAIHGLEGLRDAPRSGRPPKLAGKH